MKVVRKRWQLACLLVTIALPGAFVFRLRIRLQPAGRETQDLHSDSGPRQPGKNFTCVGWRQTGLCSPFGPVTSYGDERSCEAEQRSGPGFCLCSEHHTVSRVACDYRGVIDCQHACQVLNRSFAGALRLPANITCDAKGKLTTGLGAWQATASKLREFRAGPMSMAGTDPHAAAAEALWAKGLRLPRRDVEAAQRQRQAFMAAAPAYPANMFSGQGIATLAGGGRFMVPAWVTVHMLRQTGCKLPMEMFFPPAEFPPQGMQKALSSLGVACRKLPSSMAAVQTGSRVQGPEEKAQARLAGFKMKIGALLLSSFKEVIFLDSDNVAVADPTALLHSPVFLSTGALLWPDYWSSWAAPDLITILGMPRQPPSSFESGQMGFDKERTWQALMLAAFMNLEGDLYYELLSGWMGKGDKETFAHALIATNIPYHLIATPAGSVGVSLKVCGRRARCRQRFHGNTMVQHAPDGEAMFLHTNFLPKWNLQLPADFESYTRRWQVVQPGGKAFWDAFPHLVDLERDIYQVLTELRCAPFLLAYAEAMQTAISEGKEPAAARIDLGLPADSFHPYNEGVDFHRAYMTGLRGPFLEFTHVTLTERLASLGSSFRHLWGLVQRPFRTTPRYFVMG
ncbi:hypothetical protein WJX73_006049 [Symbiochloris irregularis]|uniref:Uncharacterized protein n=1 Tax=Symbiochloris irregularis TaxID=706552 RepID=A0AAW1NZG9_9CHLO